MVFVKDSFDCLCVLGSMSLDSGGRDIVVGIVLKLVVLGEVCGSCGCNCGIMSLCCENVCRCIEGIVLD
jgi:hypothetical protein